MRRRLGRSLLLAVLGGLAAGAILTPPARIAAQADRAAAGGTAAELDATVSIAIVDSLPPAGADSLLPREDSRDTLQVWHLTTCADPDSARLWRARLARADLPGFVRIRASATRYWYEVLAGPAAAGAGSELQERIIAAGWPLAGAAVRGLRGDLLRGELMLTGQAAVDSARPPATPR